MGKDAGAVAHDLDFFHSGARRYLDRQTRRAGGGGLSALEHAVDAEIEQQRFAAADGEAAPAAQRLGTKSSAFIWR